jgi:DNA-directed RNA polymerase subunit H (RpoH/RPB5)
MSKNIEIEKFLPELLPIEKSYHQQIIDIKKTIIKIFTNRGFINEENKEKYIKKLISDENDDMEYLIQIDNDKNYNTEIPNKKIYIKIFDYKISSINKSSPIGEFISKYDKDYKFIVVQEINSRSEDIIESYQTPVEIFKFNKLQSDITEHDLVPQHIVLTKEEGDKVLESYRARKRDMPLIRSNDAVAKYYNMKPDEIVKIIRPSPVTGEAVAYRYVIKSKDSKAKT